MTDFCNNTDKGFTLPADDQDKLSLLEKLQKTSDYPLTAGLSITERCPLSCPHCYIDGHCKDKELSLNEIIVLLDELESLGVLKLSITGGEPAARNDLIDIVRAAWERHFLISLKTSGATLTFNDVEALRNNGLSKIEVSLYHIDSALHDKFVGMDGAWKNTISCIEQFSSYGGGVSVNMVLMNWNSDAVEPLSNLCEKNNWRFLMDPKVTHKNDGKTTPVGLRADLEILQTTTKHVLGEIPARSIPNPDESLCNAGKSLAYFTSSGDVWLCPSLPVSMGNIRENTFKEIWDNSTLRGEILNTTWGKSPECLSCAHSGFCTRCPGESFLEHGDFQRTNTVDCQVAEARHLAWLKRKKRQ